MDELMERAAEVNQRASQISPKSWENDLIRGLFKELGQLVGALAHKVELLEERKDKVHPATEAILKHFTYDHLPKHLQDVSRPVCQLAHDMADELDGPELTAGLRKLLEAKDCFVRAALDG